MPTRTRLRAPISTSRVCSAAIRSRARKVTLRNGPYGLYVQLGEAVIKTKETPAVKPQTAVAAEGHDSRRGVTLEKALLLLSLPRELGPHPEDQEMVLAGVGRFGPYVKHGPKYKSIPADESVLEIGMNRAVALLAEAKVARGRAAVKPIRVVGPHPATKRRSSSMTAATACT